MTENKSFQQKTLGDALNERDEAMARVDTADDAAFEIWVTERIKTGAKGAEFTGDHIWNYMEKHNCPQPHDGRKLGPLLKRLQRQGLIEPTGKFQKSTRRHATPISVWRIK
jgi:hypothetical protein